MSYSLVSRDIMAAMVEIHALGYPHDAMVTISGNDKSVPAHLQAIARCDLPAFFAERLGYLRNLKLSKDQVIHPRGDPFWPCVGHVAPEALEGGPIALVEDGT